MPRRRRRGQGRGRALLSATALALALAAPPAQAETDDPAFLVAGFGVFDVNDEHRTGEARLEFRSGWRFLMFKPFLGMLGNDDGALYGYAGVLVDLYWGRRIVTTLSFAPGAYHRGSSKDLGATLEFRSQIEFAYRFADRSRLGLAYGHLSNAGIGDDNPGTESLILSYALPLDGLFAPARR
ncbi:MAG: acyloxyacyl hydrolase [Alphaproteobacteria bacterium]|nr:acyloxyacyl hydrolase [Alphaproteobacteria bacterium]